jgi:hypothetical protein
MTCVIGGVCSDGVVLISDSKITYDNHPPDSAVKIQSEFTPIVTAGAGPTDLYDIFRNNVVPVMQSGTQIPNSFPNQSIQITQPHTIVQTFGVIHMYAPGSSGGYDYGTIQGRLTTLVKKINVSQQARDRYGQLDVLTATQLADIGQAKLTYTTSVGVSDVPRYQSIGVGEQFSYVFLKPFYGNVVNKNMYNVIRLGYFIIKFLDRFKISDGIGGPPQFWGIPNRSSLFSHNDKSERIKKFEQESDMMLQRFKDTFIDALNVPKLNSQSQDPSS